MEQSPWQANSFSASQEIPRILWTLRVRYSIHKKPPAVLILSQINPVPAPHPTTWRSISILAFHQCLGLPSCLCSSTFSHQTLYAPLTHTCCMNIPPHSSSVDHPNSIWWRVQIKSSSLHSFLHSPVTSSLLGPNILLSALFSNSLRLIFSLNVRDPISHPYKTKAKLYFCIF